MPACSFCGEQTSYPYTCNYCDQDHCSEHRLPENHRCVGLYDFTEKHLEGGGPDTSGGRKSGKKAKKTKPTPSTEYGTVETSKDPEWEGSPDTELRSIDDVEAKPNGSLDLLLGLFMLPYLFLYHGLTAVLSRPVTSLVVGTVLLSGSAAIISGPVDLGDFFGRDGEELDEAVTDGVDRIAAALTRNETDSRSRALNPNATPTPTRNTFERLLDVPRSRLVELIHVEINERRLEQGLRPLDYDSALGDIAQQYSETMLSVDTLSHTGPGGDTFEDRYAEDGYYCRVPVGENRYSHGGENILYTYYETPLTGDRYYDTPKELAGGMVESWMNSPGHRENILKPYWESEGLGVAAGWVNGEIKVYATQNFC